MTVWDFSGIVAAAYDHFFGDEPYWDQALHERRLRANGGRALEVSCGTGRLLLPLLRDGLQAEGLDASREMLEPLRAKARTMNLAPVVYELPMQAFNLPQRYRTLFVPACTLQILVDETQIRAALACLLSALEPGGELLLSITDADAAAAPITDWRERPNVYGPDHAAQVVSHERVAFEDRGRWQRWPLRHEVERRGQPMAVFFRDHDLRRWRPEELRTLLESVGFEGIDLRRGYTEPQSSDPADDLVLGTRRPLTR